MYFFKNIENSLLKMLSLWSNFMSVISSLQYKLYFMQIDFKIFELMRVIPHWLLTSMCSIDSDYVWYSYLLKLYIVMLLGTSILDSFSVREYSDWILDGIFLDFVTFFGILLGETEPINGSKSRSDCDPTLCFSLTLFFCNLR